MMPMNVVVFLYSFNDIDHIAPVAWALLNKGHRVRAVMLDPACSGDGDPRMDVLEENASFSRHQVADVFGLPAAKWLFQQTAGETQGGLRRVLRKLLRITGTSIGRARAVLDNWKIDVCIFEWGSTGGHNRKEFHTAARQLGTRTICLPHGMNIYTHPAANQAMQTALSSNQMDTIRSDYVAYDAYVFQSAFHRDIEVELGVPANITRVMGSARFCPEWADKLRSLYPAYVPASEVNDGTKVVFMLPHWTYNVDRDATLALIEVLARDSNVHLIVKDHTRGTGRLPQDMRDIFDTMSGAETASEAPSVALIAWSDVVICFGSSIALEAHLQGKLLINPRYLHSNQTIFEETGSSIETTSLDHTRSVLEALTTEDELKVPETAIQNLYQTMIYGGRAPFNVLEGYCDLIEDTMINASV